MIKVFCDTCGIEVREGKSIDVSVVNKDDDTSLQDLEVCEECISFERIKIKKVVHDVGRTTA